MSAATGLNMASSMLLLQIAFGKCSKKYQIYSYILSLEGTDRNLHVHTKQHYVVYYWEIIWASQMININRSHIFLPKWIIIKHSRLMDKYASSKLTFASVAEEQKKTQPSKYHTISKFFSKSRTHCP